MSQMSQAASNLNWLITNFVDNTPGVSHTVVVSADGLLLAMS
ncbi:putative regulator of Ras-like GTPase activity (Roadblock/LC7/MglB family), partial [Kitasatospora sp. MAP12-22]